MGRKTYFGIPANKRPLPGRLNIVLTSDPALDVPSNVILRKSLDEAMTLLETDEKLMNDIEGVWIVGGYSVYKASINSPNVILCDSNQNLLISLCRKPWPLTDVIAFISQRSRASLIATHSSPKST